MAAQNSNEGFYVLDDFVAKAVPGPARPVGNVGGRGMNEGFVVLEDVVFNAGRAATPGDAIKSLVGPLVAYIAASNDPAGTLALCQQLLLAEFANRRNAGRDATAG